MNVGNLKKNFLLTTFIAVLFLVLTQIDSFAQDEPFIPKYNAVKRSERCFSITLDVTHKFGAVWFKDRGNFDQDTTLYFVVYMGNKNEGADGLAFVMHNDPRDITVNTAQQVIIGGGDTFDMEAAAGDDGGGLGYAMHTSRVDLNTIPGPHPYYRDNHRIQPSVAIEIDTYYNGDVQDGNGVPAVTIGGNTYNYQTWDHTAVVYNGDVYNQQQLIEDVNGIKRRIQPALPIAGWGENKDIEDNNCYAYRINWIVNADGTQTLELWADNYNPDIIDAEDYSYHLVMRHTDDMIEDVFSGETNLRFGFTGSTGGQRNEQTICLLGGNTRPTAENDFANTKVNTPVDVDVESNDQDFDGDNLFVPTITRAPDNGTAAVVQVGDGNMIRYTPNANFTGLDSIQYRTCDVDSDKCYALCDEAYAYISVGCDEYFIGAQEVAPYTLCDPSLTPNGVGEAFYVNGTGRGTFWSETLNYANGTTSGGSPYTWSASFDNTGTQGGQKLFYVESNVFRARTRGSLGTFETQEIDISQVTDLNISLSIGETGNHNDSDSIKVVYILDNGPEITFDNGYFRNDFGSAMATADGLNGSTLRIKIYVRNTNSGEQSRDHYWDNLNITAVGPIAPPSLTYHWFEGSIPGTGLGTGEIMGQLKDTTYYIFAVDPTTGCRSDTVSVTISNASEPISEDSIFIVQVSPFTKCELPFDGELRGGVIENGTDSVTAGYRFEWRFLDDPGAAPIRTGAVAANLGADDFLLTVISETTGCAGNKMDSVESNVIPPVIFPEVLSHVYSCDDPNSGVARVRAEIDGLPVTSGLVYYWYEGLLADVNTPADHIGDTITTLLPDQDYAIIAVDTVSGCTSETRTLHINDLRSNPVPVVTSAAEQISCDTDNPTGAFTAAVDDNGSNVTSGFTFNWYRGLNDVTPAKTGYTGGPDVDELVVDQYRLIVSNDTSGCFAVLDTAIIENLVYPEIDTVTVTHVDICGTSPNGSLTITPVGDISDFNYRVYSGLGVVPGNLIQETANNVLNDLAVSNYTVTIVDQVTQCVSPSRSVNIADSTRIPEATFVTFPQISCDPSQPTGRITATVSQKTTADHTFEWFVTNTSGASVTTTAGTNGEIAEQLMNGSYALRLTDNTSNCENVYFPNVGENITYPVIDTAYSAPSVNCSPNFNGELLATADGGQTDASIFTFTWRDSTNAVVSTDAHALNIAPGEYELVVTNDTTTCNSNPYPVTVDDESIIPDPEIEATNNSSCDVANPNGEFEVTNVTNEGAYDPANYSFEWYITNSSGTQLVIPDVSFPNSPDSSHVFGLSEETYALVITNKATNCSNEVLSSITDINIKPVLDYPTITDATRCTDPFMSAVEVTVNGGLPIPAGYSFRLENGTTGDVFTNATGVFEDFTAIDGIQLPPGTEYRIIALNAFNCPSDTIEFEIQDDSTDPVFSLNAFDNTSCEVTLPNGIIVASTDGTYNVNSIEWFINNTSGSNVIPTISTALIIRDDSMATGLSLNDYAVRITADNGCTSVEFASIDDVMANKPLIDSLYAENLTSCVIDNGLIGLGVSPLELLPPDLVDNRTYTFHIDNSGTILSRSTDPLTHPDSVNFVNLPDGDWDAYVVDDFTHCESDPITVSLLTAPEIYFNVNVTPVPSCGDMSGVVDLDAESPGFNENPTGLGFTFDWFEGNSTSGASVSAGNIASTAWTSEASSLASMYYTVLVTDNFSQCSKDTSIFVYAISVPILKDVIPNNATQCLPSNGGLTVDLDLLTTPFPPGRDYSDYRFLVYKGRSFDPSDPIYRIEANPLADPIVFSNDFETGEYTVVVQEDFGSNCYNDPVVFEIELDFDLELTPFVVVSDSSCTGGAATGILDASFDDFAYTVTQVNYEWFSGNGTSVPVADPADGDPATVTDLLAGTYTAQLEVTGGDGLGCVYTKPVNLSKIRPIQDINATITNNINCSPFNGEIVLDDITISGSSYTLNNFEQFKILDEDGIEVSVAPFTDTNWAGLSPTDYYLTARKITTQCLTRTKKVTVGDDSQKPVLNLVMDSPDYSCNDLIPTGEITATAAPAPGVTYSWQWTNSLGNPVNPGDITSNPTTSSAINLADDVYTIVVTDNDGDGVNEGCFTSRNFTLTQGSISIVTPIVLHTHRTICEDNASITVNEIEEKRNSVIFNTETSPYSDYESVLYNSALAPINTGTSSWAIFQPADGRFGATNEIPVGTYYIKARNTTTGCDFGPPKQVIIKDVSKKPVINITMESPDYACDISAVHTGVLATVAYGGSDNDATAGNFSYLWTDLANIPITTDAGTPPRAIDLPEGEYKLVVTDNSGLDEFCENTRTFKVTHELQEIVIVAASGTDQTWCRPNGTFQVEGLDIIESGTPRFVDYNDAEFLNYAFSIYVGNLDPSSLFDPTHDLGTPANPIDSLSANTYFALAQNNGTLCESQPRQVIIRDRSQDPLIDLNVSSPNYSLNYGNTSSLTGVLEADAMEVDGTKSLVGYEYKWYRNEADADSLFFTSVFETVEQTQQNLRDADYFVEVLSDSTGCISIAAINLPFIYLKPKFNPVVTAQTHCDPLNGAINIPDIRKVQDSTETFDKYEFFWHFGDYDFNTPDYVEYGGNGGNNLEDIAANSYYIQALDTFWMVQSDPVKVIVADSTVYPKINFNASLSDRQTSCNPATPNGALSVIMGAFDIYSYEWFAGTSASGVSIGSTETIVNRPAGNYTVRVTSTTTGCSSVKTYEIVDDMRMPVLALSTSPVTNCLPEDANGIASANIINIVNSTYDFYWYAGQSESGTPAFTDLAGLTSKTNSAYTNISAGFYTVVAMDTFDCRSVPYTIEVKENLKYPIITADELSPLTHCDPAKANAVWSARGDGKVAGYTFHWNIKDGPLYNEGPIVNNLRDETYRLLVTNDVTGCNSFVDIRPSQAFVNVPAPIPTVLNDRTSCIEPNGVAMSDILGKFENYYFTYMDASVLDSLTNPRNGSEISELDISEYYVFATDRTSGCISDSILYVIRDARYVPDYDLITEPSSCIEPTGSAEAVISDIIRPYAVRWYDEDGFSFGESREILNKPSGIYHVAVEGTEGCIDSTQVEIGTDLVIFNGVSANNDGRNDIFHIECIDLFPFNNVKIFNRAGELVYEMNNYDTYDPNKNFGGSSNRGPVNGNRLAIGTYFYVVDKGDGSKPAVGYLELTR